MVYIHWACEEWSPYAVSKHMQELSRDGRSTFRSTIMTVSL